MSALELSVLPKLRKVGLARVNNLTDEAIYAFAEGTPTLEDIHLDYCDQITVPAVYFLLQKLDRLKFLTLAGFAAFRDPEFERAYGNKYGVRFFPPQLLFSINNPVLVFPTLNPPFSFVPRLLEGGLCSETYVNRYLHRRGNIAVAEFSLRILQGRGSTQACKQSCNIDFLVTFAHQKSRELLRKCVSACAPGVLETRQEDHQRGKNHSINKRERDRYHRREGFRPP